MTLGTFLRSAAAGTIVALGGAIKDAPYEGFETPKFLRSPIIAGIEGVVLEQIFPEADPILLALSTIATERLTVEAYKVYRAFKGQYKPAKFTVGEWGRYFPQDHR